VIERRVFGMGVIGVAILAVSCSDTLGPDVDQVIVSLSLSAPDLVPRDTVEFRVVGTNPTERTLRFTTHECSAFRIRLLSSAGDPVYGHPNVCNDIGQEHVLAPGASIEEVIVFDGTSTWGPFVDENGQEAKFVVGPGRYTVVARLEGAIESTSDSVSLRIWPIP